MTYQLTEQQREIIQRFKDTYTIDKHAKGWYAFKASNRTSIDDPTADQWCSIGYIHHLEGSDSILASSVERILSEHFDHHGGLAAANDLLNGYALVMDAVAQILAADAAER